MQSKSLLIAIAAFALTTTGTQAYGGAILNRANLTEDQRTALEEARELRQSGKANAARDRLVEAGINETTLLELRQAAHQVRSEMRVALEADDYERFKAAIADTPLADIITTPEDFARFQEAHELRERSDFAGAHLIFDELGMPQPPQRFGSRQHQPFYHLTAEQRDALHVARQANDRATVRAILEEAGMDRW